MVSRDPRENRRLLELGVLRGLAAGRHLERGQSITENSAPVMVRRIANAFAEQLATASGNYNGQWFPLLHDSALAALEGFLATGMNPDAAIRHAIVTGCEMVNDGLKAEEAQRKR